MRPGVLEAMAAVVQQGGNPSSLHALGRRARKHLEGAQAVIRAFCKSQRGDVIGCGSLEEARTLAVLGIARAQRAARGTHVVGIDAELWQGAPGLIEQLRREGFALAIWDNLKQDTPPQLQHRPVHEPLASEDPEPVSMHAVALVAGCTCDWALRAKSPQMLSQWVQGVGLPWYMEAGADLAQHPWDLDALKLTALAIKSAPLGGPPGAAALVLEKNAEVWPLWGGGQQQLGRRPGTEAVAVLVGFAEALRDLEAKHASENSRFLSWQQRVFEQLGQQHAVNSDLSSCIGIATDAHRVSQAVLELGHQGLMVGWALASQLQSHPSAALRLCMGWNTCETDIVAAMAILKATQGIWERQA